MVREAEPERVIRGQKGLKTEEEDIIMTMEKLVACAAKTALMKSPRGRYPGDWTVILFDRPSTGQRLCRNCFK